MARHPYVGERELERRGGIADEIRGRFVDAVGLEDEAVHAAEINDRRPEGPAAPTPIDRAAIDEALEPRVGSVYTVFSGSYGQRGAVKIKRALVEHQDVVEGEKAAMEALDESGMFQRLHYSERSENYIDLVVTECRKNLYDVLHSRNVAGDLGLCDRRMVLKGIVQALGFAHGKGYAHGDLRTKNVGFVGEGCD